MKPKEQWQAGSFLDDCTSAGRALALNKFSSESTAETKRRDDKGEKRVCAYVCLGNQISTKCELFVLKQTGTLNKLPP